MLSFLFIHFISSIEHPSEINPDLYHWAEVTGQHTQTFNYWAEVTGQHTQTFNTTDTNASNVHWPRDQLSTLLEFIRPFWSPIQALEDVS